jgi:hypothetical protein
LGSLHQSLHLSGGPLHQAPLNGAGTLWVPFAGILFDHLGHEDAVPRSQMRSSCFAGPNRFPKDGADGLDVRRAAVHAEQQRSAQSTGTNLLHQGCDQRGVTASTEHPAQPESGTDLHRHSHPDNAPLDFHAYFVSLYLSQVSRLIDQMLMHLFAVLARAIVPVEHGSLIQAESRDNGLHWTAMGQQGNHDDDQFLALPQAIEDRAFACGERRVAHVADVATILLAVNSDIAPADLPSCRTGRIVAKYSLWVHWLASLSDLNVRLSLPMDSVFVNSHPDHGLMGCYRRKGFVVRMHHQFRLFQTDWPVPDQETWHLWQAPTLLNELENLLCRQAQINTLNIQRRVITSNKTDHKDLPILPLDSNFSVLDCFVQHRRKVLPRL